MTTTFKNQYEFKKRIELCNRIKKQYSDRVAVIINNDPKLIINRKKFLAPKEISMACFTNEIRKHITNLRPEEAIFLLCGTNNGIMVPISQTVDQVYDKYKDDDGFLYIHVSLENTFGKLYMFEQVALKLLDNMLDTSRKVVKGLHMNF
jgi:GABA(A) receptor-associated protein